MRRRRPRPMPRGAEEIVARARALVGVRFRPQGRSRETGLDCVGLVAAAIGATRVPRDYALRSAPRARLLAALDLYGRRVEPPRPGDVLAMETGPGQLHLGVLSETGLIHGDAALRRVVERPGPVPWQLLGAWRMEG
jgi:murein DD-endopeptidase / murein LD-carboxypeptidase